MMRKRQTRVKQPTAHGSTVRWKKKQRRAVKNGRLCLRQGCAEIYAFCNDSSSIAVIEKSCKFFFLICIVGGGVQTGSTRHVGHLLAYYTCPGWLWGWRIWWNEWQVKPKYSEKTCPDATLFTTNPTWPDPGLNPGRRGGKPETNRFSYGVS
jgi:hypothetical protein